MWRKRAIPFALIIVIASVGVLIYWELVKSGKIKYNKYDRRAEGGLKVGDRAPDLQLLMFDGSPVRLSSLWEHKPLFLVLGSCT
jgi:hypothetical protein